MHESATAILNIEHDGVCSRSEFLAHDRAADQRYVVHRAGDIAQRIETFVRRHQVGRLADDGHSAVADDADEIVHGKRHVEAGNRLEFIDRAAGMAQASTRYLGDLAAAGSHQWGGDQGGSVGHAAGGMLVDFDPLNGAQINDLAGISDGSGEIGGLPLVHLRKPDSHEQGRGLIIGDSAGGITAHKEVDLLRGKHLTVSLFQDYFLHQHRFTM